MNNLKRFSSNLKQRCNVTDVKIFFLDEADDHLTF
jgi:hypothetical protein